MFDFTRPVAAAAGFFGREGICKTLTNNVESTVFIGEARIGKTSLLLELERQLEGTAGKYGRRLPIYLNMRKPTFRKHSDVYSELIRAVFLRLTAIVDIDLQEDYSTAPVGYEQLIRLFDSLKLQGVAIEVVALLDNLEQPAGFMDSRLDFFSSLREVLDFSPGRYFRILSTATSDFLFLEDITRSKLLSRLNQVRMNALSKDETALLLEKEDTIRTSKQRKIIQEFVYGVTGGHPCLVQELLSNTLRHRVAGRSFLKTLELEVADLSRTGGSFFQDYLRVLTLDEVTNLVSLAFSAKAEASKLPREALRRFVSAGLLTGERGLQPIVKCQMFFDWLRGNLGRVLSENIADGVGTHTAGALASRLRKQLPEAIGPQLMATELRVQDVIQGVLAANNVSFIREEEIETEGKKARIDFGLSQLDCALEVKLVKTSSKVGAVIDELLADMDLYGSHYGSFLAIIAAAGEYKQLLKFIDSKGTPFCHFLLVAATK